MVNLTSSFEIFKFKELNCIQREAITQIVLKHKDVFVSLPTGFGKSIIFQALPLVFDQYAHCNSFAFAVVNPEPE